MNGVLAVLLLGVAVVPALLALLWLHGGERGRWPRVLLAMASGTAVAALMRLLVDPAGDLSPAPGAGGGPASYWLPAMLLALVFAAIGEVLKALPLAGLTSSRAVVRPTDAAAYGVATGIGFALYLAASRYPGLDPADPLAGHLVFGLVSGAASGMLGAALGFGKLLMRPWPRLACVLAGLSAAVAVQAGALLAWYWAWYDTRFEGAVVLLLLVPPLLVVSLFLLVHRAERRIIRRQLEDEVALAVLPGWVVAIVPSFRRRIGADWWPRIDERRAIVQLLTQLALRKEQLDHMDGDVARLYSLEVGRLRTRARALLTRSVPASLEEDLPA